MPGHPSARERPPPPATVADLMARAEALSGRTIAEVAEELGERVPADLKRHKGWVGNLVEHALGADAASRDEPDFMALAIELKTIPVNGDGEPRESTYVSTVPLMGESSTRWTDSNVQKKLARVLWVPIVVPTVDGDGVEPGQRIIGSPLLWSPTAEEAAALEADWHELMDMVCLGELETTLKVAGDDRLLLDQFMLLGTVSNLVEGEQASADYDSMVRTSAPSQATAKARQLRAGAPSIITVQAPHTPCSQPIWVPVKNISSRRKSARLVRGATSAVTASPFTVSVTRFMPCAPLRSSRRACLRQSAPADHRHPCRAVRRSRRAPPRHCRVRQ